MQNTEKEKLLMKVVIRLRMKLKMMLSKLLYDSPALKPNKLVNDVFSPMSSCRRDKQKSIGFIYIITA
ncbi:hypothetical protein LUU34_00405400 [Aix galericulata]|nr:hypothetical protein LUU34_00405400 [Aix galericulata]